MAKKKTVAKLKKELTKWFNRYVRLRDCTDGYANCISCGKLYPFEKLHAGHYVPSTYSPTRYDERNVNAQCGFNCNLNKSGNLIEYRFGLIDKIGEEGVIELEENRNNSWKWSRVWLEEQIEIYKQKCNDLSDDC